MLARGPVSVCHKSEFYWNHAADQAKLFLLTYSIHGVVRNSVIRKGYFPLELRSKLWTFWNFAAVRRPPQALSLYHSQRSPLFAYNTRLSWRSTSRGFVCDTQDLFCVSLSWPNESVKLVSRRLWTRVYINTVTANDSSKSLRRGSRPQY